jgi:4-hydroxyphenylpyruvate dioxygenase-like putative hemolysin
LMDQQRTAYCCKYSRQMCLVRSFFEIIQRKGNEGFGGRGDFQALFGSIELDQIRRGLI